MADSEFHSFNQRIGKISQTEFYNTLKHFLLFHPNKRKEKMVDSPEIESAH